MFKKISKKSFKKAVLVLFLLMMTPLKVWSYGSGAVEKSGSPIKLINFTNHQPLVWNVETGSVRDDRPYRSPPISLSQVDAFCQANPNGNPPGSGSGGCSLNPFVKNALANAASSNAEGVGLIGEAFGRWKDQAASFGDVSFIKTTPGTPLNDGGDVNICNANNFIDFTTAITTLDDPRICGCLPPDKKPATCNSACVNPIIFDTNSELIAAWGYDPFSVLAITSLIRVEGATPGQAVSFNMVIGGLCLEGSPEARPNSGRCGPRYDTNDLKAIITHEAGHALGLAHSQVNKPLNYNPALHTIDNPTEIVTMYPGLLSSAQSVEALSLHKDDLNGYAHLYGDSTQFCTIKGTVTRQRDGSGVRCVELVVRSSSGDKVEAVSFVSGAEAPNNGIPGTITNSCIESGAAATTTKPHCGDFAFQVKPPAANTSYTLEVNSIGASNAGSNIGPCSNPPSLTSVQIANRTIVCSPNVTKDCNNGDFSCPQVEYP